MNRTGIEAGSEASALYKKALAAPYISVRGLHVYDGHIKAEDLEERTVVCDQAFELVEKMVDSLKRAGFEVAQIVAGGCPTFPIHVRRKGVDLSPGTFVFWDLGYHRALPEQAFEYAALVLTRVISIPEPGLICVDLGYKSIASESELNKRIFFLNAPDITPVAHSEEHLVLKTTDENQFHVGDVLYGVPYHICPTCALYERASVVVRGRQIDEWKILARDRKLNV